MSSQHEYRRQAVKGAMSCFPERTRIEFQAAFQRLAADEQFLALDTFKKQAHFAQRFLDADESLEKDVPYTELAKFFNVAHSESIRSILKSANPDYGFMGKPSTLSDQDFADIAGWVREAALDSNPVTLNDIVAKINVIKHKTVSVDALRMALKRRKTVKFITARPVEACRLRLDEQKIQRFLDETETVLRDVPPAFIFNMDETGIDEKADAKNKRALVHNDFRGRQTQSPITRNREHATVVACIAADGTAVKPLVVVTHRTTRDTLRLKCWGDDKVCFRNSERGYVNHELFMGWLRSAFIPSVDERRAKAGNPEQTAFLVLENCASHRSNAIDTLCRENNVRLVYLVPNTTHIFQPLDLCFFAAFKAKLRSTPRDETIDDEQTRRLIILLTAWDEAKKVGTIRASFEIAGFVYRMAGERVLVSFSRHAVRGLQQEGQEEEPQPQRRRRDRRRPIQN